jgi:hypothetical protein
MRRQSRMAACPFLRHVALPLPGPWRQVLANTWKHQALLAKIRGAPIEPAKEALMPMGASQAWWPWADARSTCWMATKSFGTQMLPRSTSTHGQTARVVMATNELARFRQGQKSLRIEGGDQ